MRPEATLVLFSWMQHVWEWAASGEAHGEEYAADGTIRRHFHELRSSELTGYAIALHPRY